MTDYELNDDKAYADAYKLFSKLKSLGLPPLTISQEIDLVKEIAYMRQEEINGLRNVIDAYEADVDYHM